MKTFLLLINFLISFCVLYAQNPEWITYNPENSGLPNYCVSSIVIDGSGNKWFGTCAGGVAKLADTTWTVYNSSNSGLPYDGVNTIAIEEGTGIKWIGTSMGLAEFNDTTWAVYDYPDSGLPDLTATQPGQFTIPRILTCLLIMFGQ